MPPADAPILETEALTKTFGALVAADAITLAVAPGERIGIIGANGAGKTTFVNMVTGHLAPSSGSIRFAGEDIAGLSSRALTERGLCRSFQIPQLFGSLSTLENLQLALGTAAMAKGAQSSPARQEEAARAALLRFGIADYAGQPAGTLPQGVRKLLDIAMAMAAEPRLILLDEPTSGVAAAEKFAVTEAVFSALQGERLTVLFVEHDMEIIARFAERVLAFVDGRVIADGPPDRVLAEPQVRREIAGEL